MTKSLEQLQKEVADHLGIDPLPIKFEFILDDSRIYYKEEYVGINIKYKNNYEECAKCITHEYRHVFQVFYCQLIDTETTRRWKGLLANSINSSNMSANGLDYIGQELEIDAFAFTKFYLEHYEGMKVVNRIDGLDAILDLYIEKNIRIM